MSTRGTGFQQLSANSRSPSQRSTATAEPAGIRPTQHRRRRRRACCSGAPSGSSRCSSGCCAPATSSAPRGAGAERAGRGGCIRWNAFGKLPHHHLQPHTPKARSFAGTCARCGDAVVPGRPTHRRLRSVSTTLVSQSPSRRRGNPPQRNTDHSINRTCQYCTPRNAHTRPRRLTGALALSRSTGQVFW